MADYHPRDLADRPDDPAERARPGRPGRAALASATRSTSGSRTIIDEQTEPWGIKVSVVEVKDVELPQTMQRAMARQAEAEREKRAKIIHAEGEFEASQQLAAGGRRHRPASRSRSSCATCRR